MLRIEMTESIKRNVNIWKAYFKRQRKKKTDTQIPRHIRIAKDD